MANKEKAEKSDFEQKIEAYLQIASNNRRYDDFWKGVKAQKGLENIISQETGEDTELVDENSEEFQRAKKAKALHDIYEKRTSQYVRDNLGSIVGSAETEKLARAVAVSFKGESEKYKELNELFSDYNLYTEFFHPLPAKRGGSKERASAVVHKILSGLPKTIESRIAKNIKDPELAKAWAEFIATIAPPSYVEKKVTEKYERIKTEIEGKKDKIADYIRDVAKKDTDYLNFAGVLYSMNKEKED